MIIFSFLIHWFIVIFLNSFMMPNTPIYNLFLCACYNYNICQLDYCLILPYIWMFNEGCIIWQCNIFRMKYATARHQNFPHWSLPPGNHTCTVFSNFRLSWVANKILQKWQFDIFNSKSKSNVTSALFSLRSLALGKTICHTMRTHNSHKSETSCT